MDSIHELSGEEPTRSTLATSSSLLADVSRPDGRRWEEFDRIYRGIVFGMARKAGLSHHDAEDVAQEVFSDLVRSLIGFEMRGRKGAFRRYLFQLVRWRIGSRLVRTNRFGKGLLVALDENEQDFADPQAEAGQSRDHSEAEFRSAVVEAMMELSKDLGVREVQMLELYYCKEWPAERIAKALGMSVPAVYVVAHRHKFRLCREILRRL